MPRAFPLGKEASSLYALNLLSPIERMRKTDLEPAVFWLTWLAARTIATVMRPRSTCTPGTWTSPVTYTELLAETLSWTAMAGSFSSCE